MLWSLKNRGCSLASTLQLFKGCRPIGVDMSDDVLRIAQLGDNGKDISLIAGGSENRPVDVKPGSGSWQRWAVEAIKKLMADGGFHGRDVIAAMPASEVFVDHIKMPKTGNGELQDAIFSEIKHKLPFIPDEAMIRYITAEEDNVLVIVTEREKIDRHLAIYEKANLKLKSIGVWPVALINAYTRFFGRRKTDIEAVVMLLNIEATFTNVAICRHKNILFAHSVPIGAKQVDGGDMVTRLILELTACRERFDSMYKKAQIGRLIFLSSQVVDKGICVTIAKQLEISAQTGDCLAAVEKTNSGGYEIDMRECKVNWTTAFGLSLS